VKIKDEIPTELSINAYPNPFNPQTTITIQIPQNMKKENLSFKIYNILGELVKTFTQEEVGNGNIIRLLWNGVDQLGNKVSSGVYIFTVSGNNFVRSLKLMLMK
jgi:flagellar hook assembly protein FlgD